MAQPNADPAGQEGLPARFQRVPAWARRRVLGMLMTGHPGSDDPGVEQFLRYAHEHDLPLDDLWAAWCEGELVAAALILPSPGRAAILFVSPPPPEPRSALLSRLVQQACAALDPSRVALVQAMLNPWQQTEVRLLKHAGFWAVARLHYLERPAEDQAVSLVLEEGVEVHHWSADKHDLFGRVILASYENTLDCPGLVGLRTIDDILQSHLAAGEVVPHWCLALVKDEQPVGVMMLSLLPQQSLAELVYLGLAPAWRGRKIGRRLLEHGLSLLPQRQARRLVLAVDEQNTPAMRLYQSLGFEGSVCKLAMIWTPPRDKPLPGSSLQA